MVNDSAVALWGQFKTNLQVWALTSKSQTLVESSYDLTTAIRRGAGSVFFYIYTIFVEQARQQRSHTSKARFLHFLATLYLPCLHNVVERFTVFLVL